MQENGRARPGPGEHPPVPRRKPCSPAPPAVRPASPCSPPAGLAAGALALGAGATTAAASADGCTYTDVPNAYVCAQVHGKKLHVDTVDVSRGKYPGGTISDYHAEVTVRSPRGTVWWFRSATHEGKSYTRAYMTRGHQPVLPGRLEALRHLLRGRASSRTRSVSASTTELPQGRRAARAPGYALQTGLRLGITGAAGSVRRFMATPSLIMVAMRPVAGSIL